MKGVREREYFLNVLIVLVSEGREVNFLEEGIGKVFLKVILWILLGIIIVRKF